MCRAEKTRPPINKRRSALSRRHVKRSKSKTVSFGDATVVATMAPSSSISQEERNQVWYQEFEMQEFRCQARQTCKKMFQRVCVEDDDTRGLEYGTSYQRQQQRALSIKIVLKAQEQYRNSEQVAMISEKCSARARYIAAAAGQKDYYAGYFPALVNTKIMEQLPMPSFPTAVGKKPVKVC